MLLASIQYRKEGYYDRDTVSRILQNIEKRRLTNIYHSHDFYEFIIMLRGSCTAFINGGEYTLVKDDVVFMSPEDSHSFLGQSGICI